MMFSVQLKLNAQAEKITFGKPYRRAFTNILL